MAALTIGLANFLMVLEALWLWRGRKIYLDVYRYWLKVFALTVAVGTASGLILEYQFGLNWSRLSTQTGDILGPLMFYEVLAAFFLEAGFLGIMLFGLKKVGPRLHFFATCAVATGSLISTFLALILRAMALEFPAAADATSCRLQCEQPDLHAGRFCRADTGDPHLQHLWPQRLQREGSCITG